MVGTDASVNADGSGRFEISGDFVGDVQLSFTGAGHNVVVTVQDVQPGQTITVTVSLSGDTGTVDVESRQDGDAVGDSKVPVCHLEGNGTYHLIEISPSAVQAHLDHDDLLPGDPVPGTDGLIFGEDCTFGPEVDIEKFTNGEDADETAGPSIPVGDPVRWTYVVTNTGGLPLTEIVVTDSDSELSVDCPAETLRPGKSMRCTARGVASEGEYQNIGTVTANFEVETELGTETGFVEDKDPSHYVGEVIVVEDDEGEDPADDTAKVALCHRTGNGSYRLITMSPNAVPAHLAHGDYVDESGQGCEVVAGN